MPSHPPLALLPLSSAEATLAICQRILRGVAEDDYHKATVCTEFDVTQLADHLIGSVTYFCALADAGAGREPGAGPDFAQATGQQVAVSDEVAQHVLGLARQIITPEARGGGSFADPIEAGPDAGLLDRLIAVTGRTDTQ